MSDAHLSGEVLKTLRVSYTHATLEGVDSDPFVQLEGWLNEAIKADVVEPQAMTVSTVSANGRPSSRVVLLRGLSAEGLTFYTNYSSHKGRELEANSYACTNFWWGPLERQVRVEGQVFKVSPEESDAYFASRPYESQAASASSPQSQVITSRAELETHMHLLEAQYPDHIPRPAHWGGFRLVPDRFEFWQGRPARLHDRFIYSLGGEGTLEGAEWTIHRIAP